jgi:hypothetical protein
MFARRADKEGAARQPGLGPMAWRSVLNPYRNLRRRDLADTFIQPTHVAICSKVRAKMRISVAWPDVRQRQYGASERFRGPFRWTGRRL